MPKVWIADDDDAIRTILDEHLKSDGLDVSSFSDGELLLNELDKDVPERLCLVRSVITHRR